MDSIVVIGYVRWMGIPLMLLLSAGVAGLTTALVLARQGYKITVVAEHMPGDLSIRYTSPWAVVSSSGSCADKRELIGYRPPNR